MDNQEITKLFSRKIRSVLTDLPIDFQQVYEIRLRVNAPLIMIYQGRERFIGKEGGLTDNPHEAYAVTMNELSETMEYIAGYSLYAFEEEMKQGFITIQGGHRVGIAGKAITEGAKVRGVKYISYINVRLSHQIKGCADDVLPYVVHQDAVYHTLIISPPRCGKTTLLRDLIRQLSDGFAGFPGSTVAVVDERSEIGGCYLGVPQNDVGIRTDILDCCPKAEGMMMLIRSMSPSIVAVDELGDYGDIHAIESVIHCGCTLLATVHGSSIDDIRKKPLLQRLINERVFERYILLHNAGRVGKIKSIFDERGTCLCEGGMRVC